MPCHESSNVLTKHRIGIMRNKDTASKTFRDVANGLTKILCMESAHLIPTAEYEVETPICTAKCERIDCEIVAIPILRAGLGMLEGFLEMIPDAKVGYVGLKRNETTHEPHRYYTNLPETSGKTRVFVLDPMLATGGSLIHALEYLKSEGFSDITVLNIISSEEGIRNVLEKHPDVDIYTCQIDEKLNDGAYIVPGLGDAGDRLNGTFLP